MRLIVKTKFLKELSSKDSKHKNDFNDGLPNPESCDIFHACALFLAKLILQKSQSHRNESNLMEALHICRTYQALNGGKLTFVEGNASNLFNWPVYPWKNGSNRKHLKDFFTVCLHSQDVIVKPIRPQYSGYYAQCSCYFHQYSCY